MLIKFRKTWAHPSGTYTVGAVADIDHDLAVALCAAGAAVPMSGEAIETAVAPPPVETREEVAKDTIIRRPRKRAVEQ